MVVFGLVLKIFGCKPRAFHILELSSEKKRNTEEQIFFVSRMIVGAVSVVLHK